MKISIFGQPDMLALAEAIKHIPPEASEVFIRCPQRNSIANKPCQHPGWLFLDVSVDNKTFINLVQKSPTAPYEVKVT